ncbi:MAG TPA: DUF72 domain-containing protein [Roseiflexaceae bacterium]|jgi:uncharacterized protein YecE (DUF72 family)|nr:DUF72 domain-containing protein [Roseiflexaceae bacterium]
MGTYYIGCPIWAHAGWVGDFFPPGSANRDFLRLYSRRLTTVEGNTTFYAVPRDEIVQRWAAETPETFRFCLKLPREISHEPPLRAQIEATQAFVEQMSPLGPRLGPFFLQLPPRFSPAQIDDLDAWLAAWPSNQRIAVEVRHDDWFAPAGEQALQDLLEQHNAGRVLMDVRPLSLGPLPGADEDVQRARDHKPDVPLHALYSSNLALVRYIGHPDLPLNEPLLDEWAARVARWLADDVAVYMFMHCPDNDFDPALCRMFHERLAQLADVPPLPWGADESPLEQQRMF